MNHVPPLQMRETKKNTTNIIPYKKKKKKEKRTRERERDRRKRFH